MDLPAEANIQVFEGQNAKGASLQPAGAQLLSAQVRGRGAATNVSGRYEREQRVAVYDDLQDKEDLPVFKTEVQSEKARTLITRNQSPDIPFSRSINPYRGCEHGCSYCYARPSHAHMGLSPGLDFERQLFAKQNAAAVLMQELSRKGYKPQPITIGSNTDPYQPIERQQRLTRDLLEVFVETRHPLVIITKSALVLRDLDLLQELAKDNLVKLLVSVTTLDHRLSRALEPRASSPKRRLQTIEKAHEHGIPVTAMVAPVIPALTDHEIEEILAACAAAGASEAAYILLRLPQEVAGLFRDWLLRETPDKYRHVMSLLRSMRGGADYDAQWHKRMRGTGPYADMISKRFSLARKRHGLVQRNVSLNCDVFLPPRGGGQQLELF